MNEQETALARRSRYRAFFSMGLLLLVLIAVYGIGYWEVAETKSLALDGLSRIQKSDLENSKTVGAIREQLNLLGQATNEKLRIMESHLEGLPGDAEALRVAANLASTERALRRAQFAELKALASKTLQAVTGVISEAESLQELQQQVDAGPQGRRIASDRQLVLQYAALGKSPIPSADDAKAWRQQCLAALVPIDDIPPQDEVNFVVTPTLKSHFESLLQNAMSAAAAISHRRTELKILIASSSDNEPATWDLAERAVEVQQEIYAEVMQTTSQQHEQELRKSISEQMATLHQEQLRTLEAKHLIEVEEERQRGLAEKTSLDRLSAAGQVAEQLRRDQQLKADFQRDLPEMEQLLQPFFSSIHDSQPLAVNYEPGVTMVLTSRRVPISFGKLNSCLALDATADSLERLYFIGGTHQNQRPKGSFPQYYDHGIANSTVLARVNRARELLVKYGPLLVENNKLAN